MPERLLIIEDEETLCESLKRVLSREGYLVDTVMSAEAGFESIEQATYDLIITDIILPGITGIELLKMIKGRFPEQVVIIMTAYASLESAVEALRNGAYDYIVKPVMHEEIKQIVKNALIQKTLQQENVLLKKQIDKYYEPAIIGESPVIKNIIAEINGVADDKNNIILTGEAGTGKRFIAKAIHVKSSRADKPFIPVHFNALPVEILEVADGGTVLLNEVLSFSAEFQAGFLAAMEEKILKSNPRYITATSRDIEAAVKEGSFSPDLFKRLEGIKIHIPPLRERKEDIRALTEYFIKRYSDEFGKVVNDIEDQALNYLISYSWPGNIRELQNVIERAVLLQQGDIIRVEHLPRLLT